MVHHQGCINMVEECIRKELWKVSGKLKVSQEERNDAITFLFGKGIENFMEMHEIEYDIRAMRSGILVRLMESKQLADIVKKLLNSQEDTLKEYILPTIYPPGILD